MRQRTVGVWLALALLPVAPGLAGCSHASPAAPLKALSLGGSPVVDGGSVEVRPGASADFTAFVVNPSGAPVILLSASVVPVPGLKPTGMLVHLGISKTRGIAGAADGWPVPGVPTRELSGAQIGPGQSNIVFGITGGIPGRNYSVAGLRIRYRYRGQIYHVTAWSAAVACVTRSIAGQRRACPDITDQVQARVHKMANGSG
jgi:hypothetical protein